jgi:hypothetical protein
MVDRPFSERRPMGPFVDLDALRRGDMKQVFGVSGTPMPDRRKNDTYITYILGGGHVGVIRDIEQNIKEKIEARNEPVSRVNFIRSGGASAYSGLDITNQGVVVRLRGSDLPISDEYIHTVEGIINRVEAIEQSGSSVSDIIIDQG